MAAAQSDLFAEPRLAGLTQAEDIVAQNEEQALIASIDAERLSPFHFHRWFGKRLTASFGWHYDFDTAPLAPTAPIPDWLFPVRERAARFACLRPGESFRPYWHKWEHSIAEMAETRWSITFRSLTQEKLV